MYRNRKLVTILALALTAAMVPPLAADCAHCVGEPPTCESPDVFPGSCRCTLSGHITTPEGDIVATVCKESGGGCYTGWFCGGDGIGPQPMIMVPDDIVKRAISPTLFSQVVLEDGYAVQVGGRAILRVTSRGVTFLSITGPEGVRDFATKPGSGFLLLHPATSCPLPAVAEGSWKHRMYLRCAYGVAMPKLPKPPQQGETRTGRHRSLNKSDCGMKRSQCSNRCSTLATQEQYDTCLDQCDAQYDACMSYAPPAECPVYICPPYAI